jgi:CheY-like chemotaxis protein
MKTIKILIVEDDKQRIRWFKENLIGNSLDIVETAASGIFLCETKKYDVIFLDHDLGGEIYVPSENENTGYQVSKAIANSINSKTPIIVHSHNLSGAKNIHDILKHAELIPFSQLKRMHLKEIVDDN